MAQLWARTFYDSVLWKKQREAYKRSQHGLCERCGKPGSIVHHRTALTPETIGNPFVSLHFGNLELLCYGCHNAETNEVTAAGSGLYFDENGDIRQASGHPPGGD